ncbi:MAG: exodeoxyribonuclease VII large subunit [Desulfuromonadales bacterium]|nr:exodeoxyribonuclease VII large subunit [Desulfuromonadales bacterium]NIR34138.1 exodeoxyribonuclease VII large subunit [Desulfuromonadales bacterium]NIS40221.1 exodeoxyribonuclease VII large subunit [Desulfuromonadales bacterium]
MPNNSDVLSVSALVALLREVVEDNFVQVFVEGEIANFAAPASGHWYFTLKDERAQLRTVMFRPQNRLLRFRPEAGMKVVCRGRMSVYPQRGEVQLVVEGMEPSGIGSLQIAFEQLKKRLAAEGLFAEEQKQPLPAFPATIGVVTSATGAAIHDILNVLRRRSAGVRVLLAPVKVQGEGAAAEVAAGIAEVNRHGEADVLIVGRGGGGIEDLWAFNEEAVARAISASRIPVISAVGHEVDTTIADLVSDLRAPTPSAAAELVVKERLALENHLDHLTLRMATQVRSRLQRLGDRVDGLRVALRSPAERISQSRQRQDDLERRLTRSTRAAIDNARQVLGAQASRLDALSPLRVLARGYSIAFDDLDGTVVRDAAALQVGERLRLRFERGSCRVVVDEVDPEG